MRQGCPLSDGDIRKIVELLNNTDLAMVEIAMAKGCTRSTVAKINQRYNVRDYGKRRSSWQLVQA